MVVVSLEETMNSERSSDPFKAIRNSKGFEESLYELAETFRVLGDLTRVRILMALAGSESCVRDLAEALDLTDSAVSHQLRILRNSRLVKFRKEGKNALYSISDEHVATIFKEGLEHVEGL
jgi:DNA-binding transcriptional ArsR family regulator